MMRILADENVSRSVVALLREAGHEVTAVGESMRGATDIEVLTYAQIEGRLLLTCDKDFGELACRVGLPASSAVVWVRLPQTAPAAEAVVLRAVLESRADWSGHYAVVEMDKIRMRPLRPLTARPAEESGLHRPYPVRLARPEPPWSALAGLT